MHKLVALLLLFMLFFTTVGASSVLKPVVLIPVNSVKVEGFGKSKTIGDVYDLISPSGPVLPYEIYCASQKISSDGFYTLDKVVYPVWFYPSAMVSVETKCTRSAKNLIKDYVFNPKFYFREIASGTAEFSELMVASQASFYNNTNSKLFCKASVIGLFNVGYDEIRFKKAIVKPFGIPVVYSTRDLSCTTDLKVVDAWKKSGFTEISKP